MSDRRKISWLGFVHLLAMPIALATEHPWGFVYCGAVACVSLLILHFTPTPPKQGR